jgi:hypothetical protein
MEHRRALRVCRASPSPEVMPHGTSQVATHHPLALRFAPRSCLIARNLPAFAWTGRDTAEGGAQRSLSVGRRSRWSFRVALPPCEAGGSGLRQGHTRMAHGASACFARLPRVAITRGDATRHVTGRDTSSSRASRRSALGLLARALIGSRTNRPRPRSFGVPAQSSMRSSAPQRKEPCVRTNHVASRAPE